MKEDISYHLDFSKKEPLGCVVSYSLNIGGNKYPITKVQVLRLKRLFKGITSKLKASDVEP